MEADDNPQDQDQDETEKTYSMQLTTICSDQESRSSLEKEITTYLVSVNVDKASIEKNSSESELDLSWEGAVSHLATLRSKMQKLAKTAGVCFEVTLEADQERAETFFIGINSDEREVEYLLQCLSSLGPRLLKRSDAIAEKCKLDAVKLKSIFNVISQLPQHRSTES